MAAAQLPELKTTPKQQQKFINSISPKSSTPLALAPASTTNTTPKTTSSPSKTILAAQAILANNKNLVREFERSEMKVSVASERGGKPSAAERGGGGGGLPPSTTKN